MNPNLPVGGSAFDLIAGSRMGAHEDLTQLGLALRYSHFGSEFKGSAETANPDNARLDSMLVALSARHHFGGGLAAELLVPAGTVRYDPGPDFPEGYFSHLGDIELSGRYELGGIWGLGGFNPSAVVQLGLGLPTGGQVRIGEMGGEFPPNLLSIGSAAYSALARLEASQFLHKLVALRANAGLRYPLTPTEHGVHFGLSLDYGVGAVVLPLDWLVVSVQLSGQHRQPSRELAEGQILSSGGDWIAGEALLAFRVNERVSLSVAGRAPLYTNVAGTQISESFTVSSGLVLSFGGGADHHDPGEGQHPGEGHHHSEGLWLGGEDLHELEQGEVQDQRDLHELEQGAEQGLD